MSVKHPKAEVAILTQNQIEDVLSRLAGHWLHPIVCLALFTGLRRGELLALQWADINLDSATLQVARALEQTRAGLRIKQPKTKSGRRTISLPRYAVDVLRRHHKARLEARIQLGVGRIPEGEPVFCNINGELLLPRSVTAAWTRVGKELRLPPVTLHSLRHSHASALISGGMDVVSVSRRLGHASPNITLSVYAHLFTDGDDKAVAILDALPTGERYTSGTLSADTTPTGALSH
jgi:integrase